MSVASEFAEAVVVVPGVVVDGALGGAAVVVAGVVGAGPVAAGLPSPLTGLHETTAEDVTVQARPAVSRARNDRRSRRAAGQCTTQGYGARLEGMSGRHQAHRAFSHDAAVDDGPPGRP